MDWFHLTTLQQSDFIGGLFKLLLSYLGAFVLKYPKYVCEWEINKWMTEWMCNDTQLAIVCLTEVFV